VFVSRAGGQLSALTGAAVGWLMEHDGSDHDEPDDCAERDTRVEQVGADASKQSAEQACIDGGPDVLTLVAHQRVPVARRASTPYGRCGSSTGPP
jgi:hypothetical protein